MAQCVLTRWARRSHDQLGVVLSQALSASGAAASSSLYLFLAQWQRICPPSVLPSFDLHEQEPLAKRVKK